MCNSLEASICSSITSLIACIVLYTQSSSTGSTNSVSVQSDVFKIVALFFLFVSLMQWYDLIFWLNPTKNLTNFTVTKLAMISNHLQPLVLAFIISRYIPLSMTTQCILLVYTVYAFFYSLHAYRKIQYTVVTDRSFPVLDWEWNSLQGSTGMYTLFVLALCTLSLELPYPFNYILLAINLGTFMMSRYTPKQSTSGKMWCIFAAYVPILLVILQFSYLQ